jgi:hypothetical protein
MHQAVRIEGDFAGAVDGRADQLFKIVQARVGQHVRFGVVHPPGVEAQVHQLLHLAIVDVARFLGVRIVVAVLVARADPVQRAVLDVLGPHIALGRQLLVVGGVRRTCPRSRS